MPDTLNLSNQQVGIVTRRNKPVAVTITATDAATGEPHDLTGATVVAKVTTDRGVDVVTLTQSVDGDSIALSLTAAQNEAVVTGEHGRSIGEFVGRWVVTVQHASLGAEAEPWIDGKFHIAAYGSRVAESSNDIAVTVGATVAVSITAGARGQAGPTLEFVEDPPGSGLYKLVEV